MARKYTAFTLVELLTVVVVISIVGMAGVFSFSVVGLRRLEAEAKKTVFDLAWVRGMAATRHHNYIVVFNTGARTYSIYQDSVAVANLLRTRTLAADIVSVTPAPARLQFSLPSGSAESKLLTLRHEGRTVQIQTFSDTGYVRIQ